MKRQKINIAAGAHAIVWPALAFVIGGLATASIAWILSTLGININTSGAVRNVLLTTLSVGTAT